MASSSPIDAPVSLICEQRRRKLPTNNNNNNSTPSSSKSATPSPSQSPKPPIGAGGGLPPPIPLSTSTPQSKPCCQSALNAGQPFCPTCYVTAILASYKQPGQGANKSVKQAANSSNSDNGGSSSATPERRLSPHQVAPPPPQQLGPVEMLSLLQQAALKQRLEQGAQFLGQDRQQTSPPGTTPTPQELFFQSLLAGHLPPQPQPPGGFSVDNLPPGALLAAARQQQQQQNGGPPGQLPPGHHPLVPPPPFFMNPATGEPAGGMMNPYGPYGGAFDINGMRRKNATRETTAVLKQWLAGHRKNPYPTKGEKIMLAIISKMTLTQVSTWFANARRRLKKENKGSNAWHSGGAGSGDDQNEGAGSNDDNGSIDGDDVELQVEDSDGEEMALPNGLDEDEERDKSDEPPQRRARFENNSRHEPVTPSSPHLPSSQVGTGQVPAPQTQQPNPVLAASIAALLEQQNQVPITPQPPGLNPFANLLQQIYGDRLSAILQIQQQLATAVRPNLAQNSNLPPQLLGQQQPNNGEKNASKKQGTIWSIAAEITSPNSQN